MSIAKKPNIFIENEKRDNHILFLVNYSDYIIELVSIHTSYSQVPIVTCD